MHPESPLDLIRSKKFIMAIFGVVGACALHFGLALEPATIGVLLSPLIVAIGAQGVADVGKPAAIETARGNLAMHAMRIAQCPACAAKLIPPNGTELAGVSVIGMLLVVLGLSLGIGAMDGCGATANGTGGSSLATGGKSWLACEKADLGKLVDGTGGLTLLGAVASDLMASNYADLIETMIAKFGGDAIGCAVLAVEAVAKAQKPPVNAMPTPLEIRASEMIQKYGWRPAPTTAISATPKP